MSALPTLDPEVADLGVALGLLTPSASGVDFDSSWFDTPGAHLKGAIADHDRCAALVRFVDRVLGDGALADAPQTPGPKTLHLFDLRTLGNASAPDLTIDVTIDDSASGYVEIGLGVSLATTSPTTATRLNVPLYRAAKQNSSVAQPFALLDGGKVQLACDLTLSTTTPPSAEFGLQGVGITLSTAISGTPSPEFGLVLKGLHLPGSSTTADLPLGLGAGTNIEHALLSLVLSLARQALEGLAGAAADKVRAALELFGLGDDASDIPALPIENLTANGVHALRDWFVSVMGTTTARDAWLHQLASLLNGSVTNGLVQVPVAVSPAVTIELGFRAENASNGHLVVTPQLGVLIGSTVGAVDLGAEVRADVLTVDTSNGAVTAVPLVEAVVTATGHGARLLDTAAVKVDSVRAGLNLQSGTPHLVLQMLNVGFESNPPIPVLDLSSPHAAASSAAHAALALLDAALGSLGPAKDDIKGLLGIIATGTMPAIAELDHLITDPLGTLAAWWNDLLHNHADQVPAVLTRVRDLIGRTLAFPVTVDPANVATGPWTIPIVSRLTLDVSLVDGRLVLEPVVSLRVDDLAGGCTVIQTEVRTRLLSVDLAAKHAEFPLAVSFGAKLRGRGLSEARIGLGPVAIVSDYLFVGASWSPAQALSAGFDAPNLAIDAGTTRIPLVLPTIDATGHLSVPAASFTSVEQLVGVLALTAGQGWLDDLVDLIGWRIDRAPRGPKLSLAALVADPANALRAWLGALSADVNLVGTLVATLAHLTGGSADGLAGVFSGSGTLNDPWLAGLGRTGGLPGVAVWMAPHGPVRAPSLAGDALMSWRPGAPGLPPDGLAQSLFNEGNAGEDAAALGAGRDHLGDGLTALAARWAGTDGMVAPPPPSPAVPNLTTVLRPLDYSKLHDVDLTQVIGGPLPPVVVRVAICSTVADLPWTAPPADRVLDLTQPGVAPASFTVSQPVAGEWFVALASRGDAGLGASDPSGVAGQAARLQQVLTALAGSGNIALVAVAGAGHAARLAADAVLDVTHLITLGTPWSGVTFDNIRNGDSGDALRLLKALLVDVDTNDDADLLLGSTLVTGGMAAVRGASWVNDIEAPRPTIDVRNNLSAYGVFGVLDAATVQRALTAVFASGLAQLAQDRASTALADPDATWLGLQVPFSYLTPPGGHGITLAGSLRVSLGSIAHNDASVTLAPKIDLEFGLADSDGWLIGGPGTSPAGGAPALELRRISGRVSVGLHGAPSSATLRLHEGAAFGTDWPSLIVEAPEQATGAIEVQPLLPEARALLTGLTTRLAAAPAGSPAALFAALLHAAGTTQADGAMVPDALAHLLHDPSATLRTVVSGPSVGALVSALAALVPGATTSGTAVHVTFGPLTATADPVANTLQLSAAGGDGLLHWQLGATVSAGPHVTVSATLGDPLNDAFALEIISGPMRAQLLRPNGRPPVPLFPTPDIDGLTRLATVALPAEAVRIVLGQVRLLDDPLHTAVDELLDALGMLAPADGNGNRAVRAPLGLFEDPVSWFKQAGILSVVAGGPLDTERIISLFEALKPFIGLAGTPRGTWPVADGITVSVTAAADGPNLALAVDATQWLAGVVGREFATGITLGLTLPGSGAPRPSVEVFVGAPDGPGGTTTPQHRSAAHIVVDASGLHIFLRPATGADIEVFPHFSGLAALLAAATQVLPPVLDALAAMTGGVKADIAAVVGGIGDGLALRTAGHFEATALGAFAADPPGYLRTHLATLIDQAGLAFDPVLTQLLGLGAGQHAVTVSPSGVLTITVRTVVVEVHPSPLAVTVAGDVGNLPIVGDVAVSIGVDTNGLSAWSAQVGPASIDLNGPVLRPFIRGSFAAGSGWEFDTGLGLNDTPPANAGYQELAARWRQAGGLDVLVRTRTDATHVTEDTSVGGLAIAAIDAVLGLIGGWVLGVPDVQTLLGKAVGTGTVRGVLADVVVTASPAPLALMPDLLGGQWSTKLLTLARNLASCTPSVHVGDVQIGITDTADVLGVFLNLTDGIQLGSGDTTITLEVDASWIDNNPPPGIVLSLLKIVSGAVTPAFGIAVDGVGVRLGKSSGPLIDAGLRLDSVAVHLFGSVQTGSGGPALAGGVEVELAGLAVPLGSGGGDNAVAKGVMHDAGGSGTPPRPAFSPAIAIQGSSAGVGVSLRAGSGDGPWYLPIQRAFGPVYLEQIGLGVAYKQNLTPRQLEMISLYLDGKVSLLGLTASVQNLRFGYHVTRPFFDPTSWEVDLDGFAIAADFGPLSLAGGLVKFPLQSPLNGVEYLGMLKIAFGTYGVDVFGGYAHPTDPSGNQFASFFVFGALHAPLGGVPAFFITGVAVGFGINRELSTPTIEQVNTHPFLQALRAGGPTPDPMQQLQSLRAIVPPHQGEYWVAAGISFTSFVLITGEVLVTVQFGDGLEIAVLGVARAQLPNPIVPLVSIELALLARFSEKEGLLLVQAQLTENSYILTPSVHLTGGFAFATWWKGPNAGQFVVTVGGYHPRFSHDGYPVVPRVGLNWQPIDAVSVSGGVYFALCSEAIMAGAGLHVAAHLGPAHATLDFGGDGIVYFDPFYFSVRVYAEARVGITIWLLFGSVDVDVSLGFDVTVEGPPIYIHGEFSVCGIGIPFSIGSAGDPAERALSAGDFAAKYLRTDSDAQIVQASVVKGGLTAGKSNAAGSSGIDKPPDGSADRPFRVVPEFIVTFVSTVPSPNAKLTHGAETDAVSTSDDGLGVAPMYAATLESTLSVEVTSDIGQLFHISSIRATARPTSQFPKGVWAGDVPNPNAQKVPSGNTVPGCDGMTIDATLPDSLFTGAPPIDYHQIELPLKGRKPLPFVTNTAATNKRVTDAAALRAAAAVLTAGSPDTDERFLRAALVMSASGTGLTTVASLRGDRASVPQFGSLADDLAKSPAPVSPKVKAVVVDRTPAMTIRVPPLVKSVLGAPLALALDRAERTTVADPSRAVSRVAPTLDGVRAATVGMSQLALQVIPRRAQPGGKTLLTTGSAPLTRLASSPLGAVANARPTPASAQRLSTMTAGLAARGQRGGKGKAADGAGGALVHEGELAVMTIDGRPAAGTADTLTVVGGSTRIICMAAGGRVLVDDVVDKTALALPRQTERVVVVALGTSAAAGGTTPGWYAGQSLPSIGWGAALGGGVVVTTQGSRVRDNRERADGGWVVGRELATAPLVVSTFTDAVTAIAIVVDDAVGGDAAADISMRLGDAQRALDANSGPLPPQVLVDGVRSILLYTVETTGPNPRVFVDGCGGGQLAGVLGSAAGVSSLAAALAAAGAAAVVQQPLVGGGGTRTVTITPAPPPPKPPWLSPPPRLPVTPVRGRVPAPAPAAKKTAKKAAQVEKAATKKPAKKAAPGKKALAKKAVQKMAPVKKAVTKKAANKTAAKKAPAMRTRGGRR